MGNEEPAMKDRVATATVVVMDNEIDCSVPVMEYEIELVTELV